MKKLYLAVIVGTLLMTGCSQPVVPQSASPEVMNTLSLRSGIEQGQLANGMRYVFAHNEHSGERVSLQLIVHSGSLDEADDQQGIAHLVEHMAFNGTKAFPGNAIIEHQEALGMAFGRDVNAMTEYHTTSYFLHLPNNSLPMLTEGFNMLSQQAFELEFDAAELEKERPVVEEEWRGGRNMMARMGTENRAILLQGSRYAERNPIGDMELVRHVDAGRIKDFWETWYHPNNMTLVIVGNTDKATILPLLNQFFAAKPAAELPQRAEITLPLNNTLQLASIEDDEITTEVVSISLRGVQAEVMDTASLRGELINELALAMLSKRLNETYQTDGEYITRMVAASQPLIPGYNNNRIIAILKDKQYAQGFSELFTQLSRYKHHGFEATDLEVAKANTLQRYRQIAEGQANATNNRLLMAIFNQIRSQSPLFDPSGKFQRAEQLLGKITLDEINRYFADMLDERAPTAIVQLNPKNHDALPGEGDVRQLWLETMANPPSVATKSAQIKPLFEARPDKVEPVSHQEINNTHIWRFANGASVWFLPSQETENQLMIRWQGLGGSTHLPQAQQRAAQLSAQNLGLFGYGGHSASELAVANAGKQIRQMATVSATEHMLFGNTDRHSLEAWLQNLNLRLTKPQTDDAVWQSRKNLIERGLKNRTATAAGQFNHAIDAIRYQALPIMLPMQEQELAQITAEQLLQAWQAIFGHAADHQLVIVGDAEPEEVLDLASRYIGHLPKGMARTDKVLPAFGEGKHDIRIQAGKEPVGLTTVLFSVAYPYSVDAEQQAQLLSRIIGTRLREALRESAGGVYSPRFGIRLDRERQQAYGMISYSHQPQRGDELRKLASDVISKVLSEGITDRELAQVKQQFQSSLAPEVLTDRHRFSTLVDNARFNRFERLPEDYLNWLEQVTKEELDALAQVVLTSPNQIDARLTPELN